MIFCMDANFVIPRLVIPPRGEYSTPNQFERMYFLHRKNIIEARIPLTVQLEIYTVLRYKGVPLKNKQNKWTRKTLNHEEIMYFASLYPDFFDLQFLGVYRDIEFGIPYKDALFSEIRYILEMDFADQKVFVERNTKSNISHLQDPYDYHLMVTAIQHDADYLVTDNFSDMINPIGKCILVKNSDVLHFLPDIK